MGDHGQYRITITRIRRDGRTAALRAFTWRPDTGWEPDVSALYGKLDDTGTNVNDVISGLLSTRHSRTTAQRRCYRLGDNFDIPVEILRTVLDAHRRAGLRTVDIDALKRVVSRCGSRIQAFNRWTAALRADPRVAWSGEWPDEWRHAEAALYRHIVATIVLER